MAAGDDARARIQRLLVTGDNRLKQGVAPEKVRESYEQALAAAREAGLEDAVRPLVEIRLADLDARERAECQADNSRPAAPDFGSSPTLGQEPSTWGRCRSTSRRRSAPSRSSPSARSRSSPRPRGDALGIVSIALGFGLALLIGLYAFGEVSGGHFNPAVSLAMFLDRRMSMDDLIGYWSRSSSARSPPRSSS